MFLESPAEYPKIVMRPKWQVRGAYLCDLKKVFRVAFLLLIHPFTIKPLTNDCETFCEYQNAYQSIQSIYSEMPDLSVQYA